MKLRYRISWPTAAVLVAVLAAIVAVFALAPPDERLELLGMIGGGGAVVLATLRPLIAARFAPIVLFSVLVTTTSACGGASGLQLKPAFATACGAAGIACAFVNAACAAVPPVESVSSSGGEATVLP